MGVRVDVQSDGSQTRVLLVEDNLDHAMLTEEALEEREACEVQHVRSRADALERLDREAFQAVVLDYRLPDGDGVKLCRHLRDVDFDGTIVLLSSAARDALGDAALEAGADTYLSKAAGFEQRVADAVLKHAGDA